jgi:carbon-monoxide dehydrogenase large subunit
VARLVLTAFIGIAPEHKLRVIAPDVGGGFGSKVYICDPEISRLQGGEVGESSRAVG